MLVLMTSQACTSQGKVSHFSSGIHNYPDLPKQHTHLICVPHPAALLHWGLPLSLAAHDFSLRRSQEFLHLASLPATHCPLAHTVKTDIMRGHASVTFHLISCLERAVTYHDRTVCMLPQMPVMLNSAG